MRNPSWKLRAQFVIGLVLAFVCYMVVRRALNRKQEALLLTLRQGITQEEVQEILGKPILVETNGQFVHWIYKRPIEVRFNKTLDPLKLVTAKRGKAMIVYFGRKNGSWVVGHSSL